MIDLAQYAEDTRRRARATKIAGTVVLGAFLLLNLVHETKFPLEGLGWLVLAARFGLGMVFFLAWWHLLSSAFLASYWRGLAGMLFWPYLIWHGMVRLRGRQRWSTAVFVGYIVLALLLRGKGT